MSEEQKFGGFAVPRQNWSKLPHQLIDLLPIIESQSELAVILYILRHTWGFQEYGTSKRITLDEFENGRKLKDGTRLDGGIGMSRPSIITGIKKAEEHGFIIVETDDTDKGRVKKWYHLNLSNPDASPQNNRHKETLPPMSRNFTDDVNKLYPDLKKDTLERNHRKKRSKIIAPDGASQNKLFSTGEPEPQKPKPLFEPEKEKREDNFVFRQRWAEHFREQFNEITGIPLPNWEETNPTGIATRWNKPLKRMFAAIIIHRTETKPQNSNIIEGDFDMMTKFMRIAVDAMRDDKLDISAPGSIEKTFKSRLAMQTDSSRERRKREIEREMDKYKTPRDKLIKKIRRQTAEGVYSEEYAQLLIDNI